MNSHGFTQNTDDVKTLLDQGLSARARFGHLALLLLAASMSIVLLSLLTAEPDLPIRTQLAFAVMLLIGLAWVGYAAWALKYRWTLHAQHRLVASIIGLVASLLFTGGAGVIAFVSDQPAAWAASGTGVFMVALAGLALLAAAHRRRDLVARRDALIAHLKDEN